MQTVLQYPGGPDRDSPFIVLAESNKDGVRMDAGFTYDGKPVTVEEHPADETWAFQVNGALLYKNSACKSYHSGSNISCDKVSLNIFSTKLFCSP